MITHSTSAEGNHKPPPPPYIIFQGGISLHIVLYFRPSADPEFDGGYGTDTPIYDDDGSFPEGEPEGEWWIYPSISTESDDWYEIKIQNVYNYNLLQFVLVFMLHKMCMILD